jgi:NitT/TauT family transport system substrate-binding protein
MNSKSIISIVFIVVVTTGGYYFWQMGQKMEEAPKTSSEVMRVAKYYWPGQFWIDIADKKGWFVEAGLNVELVDTNPDYYQSLLDMVDGKIDTNTFPYFDFVQFNVKDADLVAVVNTDISDGAEAMVAKEEIKTIADLDGKRIGVSSGFYTEYLLNILLKENGLTEKVFKVEITSDQNDEKAPEEFIKDSFDAVITWEPVAGKVVATGGHYLWDSSEKHNINGGVQVFKREFIKKRPSDVQIFVNVWYKTAEFIKNNPDEAFEIIALIYDLETEAVQEFVKIDRVLDLRDNLTAFSYSAGFESLHGVVRQINDFMIEQGLTDKRLDSTEFLDSRFIRNLE